MLPMERKTSNKLINIFSIVLIILVILISGLLAYLLPNFLNKKNNKYIEYNPSLITETTSMDIDRSLSLPIEIEDNIFTIKLSSSSSSISIGSYITHDYLYKVEGSLSNNVDISFISNNKINIISYHIIDINGDSLSPEYNNINDNGFTTSIRGNSSISIYKIGITYSL